MTQESKQLPVLEDFYTIQGEGANAGKPAYFIPLSECAVGCHWCAVIVILNAGVRALYSLAELVRKV